MLALRDEGAVLVLVLRASARHVTGTWGVAVFGCILLEILWEFVAIAAGRGTMCGLLTGFSLAVNHSVWNRESRVRAPEP